MRRNQHAEFLTLNDDDALELFGQAVQGLYSGEACHESQLDAEHVENTKVVSEYQEVIDQLLDDQMSADLGSMKVVHVMADFRPLMFMLDYPGTELIERRADHDAIRMCKKIPGVVNTNRPCYARGTDDAICDRADAAV